MKQRELIFNFFVNRNWKKLTDSRKRAKILADNRKSHHPTGTLIYDILGVMPRWCRMLERTYQSFPNGSPWWWASSQLRQFGVCTCDSTGDCGYISGTLKCTMLSYIALCEKRNYRCLIKAEFKMLRKGWLKKTIHFFWLISTTSHIKNGPFSWFLLLLTFRSETCRKISLID